MKSQSDPYVGHTSQAATRNPWRCTDQRWIRRLTGGWSQALALGLLAVLAGMNGGCCQAPPHPDFCFDGGKSSRGDEMPASFARAAGSNSATQAGETVFIPGAAHVSGANNTNWRTDVEVKATGNSTAAYKIALLKRNQANNSPVTKSFQLAEGTTRRFADILASMFNFSGGGALKITVSSGSIVVTSRTYNQTSAGTYGQFIPGSLSSTATTSSGHCRLIQLSQSTSTTSGYRSNLGLLNSTARSYPVQLDLYRANGAFLGSRSYSLRPWELKQVDRVFTTVTGAAVDDGYAIVSTDTSGAAFLAYASVVDNATGDPVYEPAFRMSGSAPGGGPSPTPTPRPTATPTPSGNLDLEPYAPDGWQNALVVSGSTGTHSSGNLTGGWGTYVDWAFANWGPEDAVFPAGSYIVSILVDNSTLVNFNSSSAFSLESGYYYSYEDWETFDIDSGDHTVEMAVDSQNVIGESDESNNSAYYSGHWQFAGSTDGGNRLRVINVSIPQLEGKPLPAGALSGKDSTEKTVGSSETYFIPAAAHASGVGGSVWRTDVEIHNAGTATMTCHIDLLKKDANNSSPVTRQISVAPGKAKRFGDILASKFSFSGSAALRFRLSGGRGMVTSRTYNQTNHGTYGQFIGAVALGDAMSLSGQGSIIQLTHNRSGSSGFRTNLGLLNCGNTAIDLKIDLYRSNGTAVGTIPVHLKALSFHQEDKIYEQVVGGDVGDGYAVVSTTTAGGKFLTFASVVDNRTGDPIYVPAVSTIGGGGGIDVSGTMGPGELASTIDLFGQTLKEAAGQDYETILVSVIDNGLESTLDDATLLGDNITSVTRINQGIRVEVSGQTTSGSIDWTYSGYTHTSTSASLDYHTTISDLVSRGRAVPFSSAGGHINAVKHGSSIVADISINASGPDASATGSAHVDTSVCTTMPISGQVDVRVGETTATVTFTDQCGVYNVKSSGSLQFRVWLTGFDIPIVGSNGAPSSVEAANFFIMTDGPLGTEATSVSAPLCADSAYTSSLAWGTATENSLHADFMVYKGWGFDDHYTLTGSFDATPVGGPFWEGTVRLHAQTENGSGSEVSRTDSNVTICSMDSGGIYFQCYSCQ